VVSKFNFHKQYSHNYSQKRILITVISVVVHPNNVCLQKIDKIIFKTNGLVQ